MHDDHACLRADGRAQPDHSWLQQSSPPPPNPCAAAEGPTLAHIKGATTPHPTATAASRSHQAGREGRLANHDWPGLRPARGTGSHRQRLATCTTSPGCLAAAKGRLPDPANCQPYPTAGHRPEGSNSRRRLCRKPRGTQERPAAPRPRGIRRQLIKYREAHTPPTPFGTHRPLQCAPGALPRAPRAPHPQTNQRPEGRSPRMMRAMTRASSAASSATSCLSLLTARDT